MFGKNPRLSVLESRKRLLLAESELNRAQLAANMHELATGMQAFAARAKSLGSIVSSAAVLVTGLVASRSRKPANGPAKKSWVPVILKGAGLISTLWLAFRRPGQTNKEM